MAESPWPARVVAGVAFAWNPFVFDRIAAGQLEFLTGYALLPWLTRAALRARSARDALIVGGWWALVSLCTLHFVWSGGWGRARGRARAWFDARALYVRDDE
jgi:hypothetical protein